MQEKGGQQTDEFLTPIVADNASRIQGSILIFLSISSYWIHSVLRILLFLENDTMVFFNYRSDRMREIVETFGVKRNFETDTFPKNLVSSFNPLSENNIHNVSLFVP